MVLRSSRCFRSMWSSRCFRSMCPHMCLWEYQLHVCHYCWYIWEHFNTDTCVFYVLLRLAPMRAVLLLTQVERLFSLSRWLMWEVKVAQDFKDRPFQAASLQAPPVNWNFRYWVWGWVSELVLHSENTVGLWGRVSMSFLAVFAWYFMFLICHNASSPFSVSLFQFAHQPSGPEEHLCPSSFPICPMPLSLAPNCSADNLFITDMN